MFIQSFYEEFRWKRLTFKDVDPESIGKLQWTNRKEVAVVYRLFMTFYTMGWLAADLVLNEDPYYYIYLTHWSQFVSCSYFGFSAFCCIRSLFDFRNQKVETMERRATELRWFHKTTLMLFNIFADSAPIVTGLYWLGVKGGLVGPTLIVEPLNIHVHLMNTVLLFVEQAVSAVPIRILHFYFAAIFGLIYFAFTLTIHWTGLNSAIYPVVNWNSNPGAAVGLFIGLTLLIMPVLHTLFYLLYFLRISLHNHIFKKPNQAVVENSINTHCQSPLTTSVDELATA